LRSITTRQRSRRWKNEEVDPIPLVADPEPLLTSHEGEVASQFEEEFFELADQRCFEVVLRVFVLQLEELQHERILDLFLGREFITRLGRAPLAEHGRLVPGQEHPLVELAARSGG
jgi:hypothetical protein